jgi:hypothetical protein
VLESSSLKFVGFCVVMVIAPLKKDAAQSELRL